ncbi:hypothetical protein MKW92_002028 [Papaver armeniacum]|nr:hypothetical protein MKW92_002028 [Papaver armeniacum]
MLAAIPNATLAKASFRCKAYAQALLYYESHFLEKAGSFNPAALRSGIFEDEDVYGGLDEPDGVSGLLHLRKSLSLDDQLLLNKKAGNWVERHSDLLNCLLNMCQLQAIVTHVDDLISRVPKYKKTWCMQGVQAAWRLGRWDLMGLMRKVYPVAVPSVMLALTWIENCFFLNKLYSFFLLLLERILTFEHTPLW